MSGRKSNDKKKKVQESDSENEEGIYGFMLQQYNNLVSETYVEKKDLEPIKNAVDTLLVNTNKVALDVGSLKASVNELKKETEANFKTLLASIRAMEQRDDSGKLKEGEQVC